MNERTNEGQGSTDVSVVVICFSTFGFIIESKSGLFVCARLRPSVSMYTHHHQHKIGLSLFTHITP